MPVRSLGRKARVRDQGDADQFYFPLQIDGREGQTIFLSPRDEPAATATGWTQGDAAAIRGIATPDGPEASTSTGTPSRAGNPAVDAQRDRERRFALQLLDLEWTTLSPEERQAVITLLGAAAAGQPVSP